MIPKPPSAKPDTTELLPFDEYDYIIVSFSGGKDSMACYLHLLDLGIPADRIELWHQAVDGEPGVAKRLWDWPVTEAYCKAFGEAFGSPMLFQWKIGGYLGEMLKVDAQTELSQFETLDGDIMTSARGDADFGTRMHFPLPTKDLSKRWCSAAAKIDVSHKVFTTDPRFQVPGVKALFITGERREESGNQDGKLKLVGRAEYAEFERHRKTTKGRGRKPGRRVDQWRAVLGFEEDEVWDLIKKYRVRAHPAYYVGWSRVSCLPCIFGDEDQWATVRDIQPHIFNELRDYEEMFTKFWRKRDQKTADELEAAGEPEAAQKVRERYDKGHRTYLKLPSKELHPDYDPTLPPRARQPKGVHKIAGNLEVWADRGTSYLEEHDNNPVVREALELALSEEYPTDLVRLRDDEEWTLPAGAFGHSGGPT